MQNIAETSANLWQETGKNFPARASASQDDVTGLSSPIGRRQIPIELLRQVLRLDPATGRLYWLPRAAGQFEARFPNRACMVWNSQFAGKEAFMTSDRHGYLTGHIFNRRIFAHHVAFALANGRWPSRALDHIDGNRANNLPPNLREATQAENMRNTALRSDNMSGVMGVSWDKENRRWRADIRVNGRRFNLGRFRSIQDAISARKAAEREHQFHENHGKIRPDTSETSHA